MSFVHRHKTSMNEIKVKLDNKDLVIKKLPIGKYAELLKQLKKLPTNLRDLPTLDNATVIEKLPEIIEKSQDDFFGLIAVATDLTVDEIKQLDLYQVVDVVIAVIEVNRYREVYEKIKKVMAQPTQKTT